jgi:hypothetical protein
MIRMTRSTIPEMSPSQRVERARVLAARRQEIVLRMWERLLVMADLATTLQLRAEGIDHASRERLLRRWHKRVEGWRFASLEEASILGVENCFRPRAGSGPCESPPGSRAKVDRLLFRLEHGMELWDPGDDGMEQLPGVLWDWPYVWRSRESHDERDGHACRAIAANRRGEILCEFPDGVRVWGTPDMLEERTKHDGDENGRKYQGWEAADDGEDGED